MWRTVRSEQIPARWSQPFVSNSGSSGGILYKLTPLLKQLLKRIMNH